METATLVQLAQCNGSSRILDSGLFWFAILNHRKQWEHQSHKDYESHSWNSIHILLSNRKMLTFGLSFLGWYLLACMRTLVRWVMCLGVNKEFIFTGVSLSDTCFNKTQIRIFSSRYFSLHCWNHETFTETFATSRPFWTANTRLQLTTDEEETKIPLDKYHVW